MSEWRRVSIGEVAREVTVGHVGSMANEYVNDGIPFLRSLNVRPHRLDMTNLMRIDQSFHKRLRKSALKPGDVVTVRTGKPGQTTVIPEWLPVSNCADLVITRPGPELDARWISYYLNSITAGHVAGQLVGAVQQHFNVKSLASTVLLLPPVKEQRAVAAVLGALDDKIAANEQMVARADELRWVQVAAEAIASAERPLSELARFVNGRPFTKDASGHGRVVIRIAELNSGLGASTVYNDIEVADEHVARPGDLLFAWSGSLTVARWYREEAIINQHIFKVMPNTGRPLWLVEHAIRTKLNEFRSVAADKATTMGHIQRRHLDELVMVPSVEDVERMDGPMSALWNRALTSEVESLQLERTRDELLPLLMSGKLRVKDAEKAVEEVL